MLAKYTTTRLELNAQVVVITTKYVNFALLVSRVRAARAARLLSNIRPIKLLYYVIAVAVVDAKAPSKNMHESHTFSSNPCCFSFSSSLCDPTEKITKEYNRN